MTDLEEWRKNRSVAVNYRCECGGPVAYHDASVDEFTKLKCGECGSIGTISYGLIREKLDGLKRI